MFPALLPFWSCFSPISESRSFKFSPEYLEELFPHLIEDEDEEQDAESETDHLQVMSTPSRSSHMMRYSLHTHLHEAFMDLEVRVCMSPDVKAFLSDVEEMVYGFLSGCKVIRTPKVYR